MDSPQLVAFAAIGQCCDQPIGEDTEIEVLQQPGNGICAAKWTVLGASGMDIPMKLNRYATGTSFNKKYVPEQGGTRGN
jgi:hypothetical protein